jgi:signal transduction histidine kinase
VSLSLGLLRRSVTTLQRKLDEGDVDRESCRETLTTMGTLLADAIDGMTRITTVVRDLRTLSRADDSSFEEISFREIVDGACRIAGSVLQKASVTVDVDDTAIVVANRGRVAQVVTNLLVNAAHAVREVDGSAIVVSTRPEAGGVVLAVEDNGPGIPEGLRERVFNPFFTTKAPADGTGLGLTIVARIASSGGGWARVVDPRSGIGARVEVFFPSVAPR